MNVTKLARTLKINPQELRDLLPRAGFHIGQKAIKIDNRTAQRIIKDWGNIRRRLKENAAREAKEKEEEMRADTKQEKKTIKIPNFVTVREFAGLAQIPVNKVLAQLMKNGVFTSINERIDFETASIIGEDLNLEVKLDEQLETNRGEEGSKEKGKLDKILKKEEKDDLKLRPPVIVVMGHVDHGKTKLLDAIRRTNVIDSEAGGITQHIGAYQVVRKNKLITFIDTPGHEAFTAMRSRGAKVADIAILVVAADDGVKPQTVEAFRIIEAAKVPFLVAINKIDKEGADIDKTKQELSSQLNITPEDWGGKTVCAPISALKGEGVEELLDIVLLTTEMEEDNLKANPKANAAGTVIESHIDKGAGPMATILIQNGTLRIGDQLCFAGKIYGKVRALQDYKGESIDTAEPSVPVRILGLKILPEVGDILEVGEGTRVKSRKLKAKSNNMPLVEVGEGEAEETGVKKVNYIVKSDVLGSAEAIEESLEKINTEKLQIKIISKGLGNITEGDINRAEASKVEILGFNVNIPLQIKDLIREKGVKVKVFNIIYDLIEHVKEGSKELIEPEIKRVELGKLKVLAIFRTENNRQIVGGKVTVGQVEQGSLIEVIREKQIIAKGKLVRLQAGKQDVVTVSEGEEAGLEYEGQPVIQEGDSLKIYKEEKIIVQ